MTTETKICRCGAEAVPTLDICERCVVVEWNKFKREIELTTGIDTDELK